MRTIPQFPEHMISEDGLTVRNAHGRNVKQGLQLIKGKTTGYLYVTIFATDYSYYTRIAVHRLVAFAWLPDPISDKHVWVNHKDGNKANNHASNLEWTTISQNIKHAYDTGLKFVPKGKDHWMYGKKHSSITRSKMSLSKQGERHPKFKGFFFVHFKRFTSANAAAQVSGLTAGVIRRKCRDERFRKEGFYFVPVPAFVTN